MPIEQGIQAVDALRAAFEALPGPVVFIDSRGDIVYQNQAAMMRLAEEPELRWGDLLAASTGGAGPVPLGGGAFRIVALVQATELKPGLYVVTPVIEKAESLDPLASYRLTVAERDVLDELIGGQTPVEVARRQGVSIATVRTHIARLHDKFGVGRTIDVIRLALQAARAGQ